MELLEQRLPLYEGVDWNQNPAHSPGRAYVSLFTREWIEIWEEIGSPRPLGSLPLYEGVDWNKLFSVWVTNLRFVSLFTREWIEIVGGNTKTKAVMSPSLRGSGLKLNSSLATWAAKWSPSLRGSGLKFILLTNQHRETGVSLFTREWIEIVRIGTIFFGRSSPSLRGSGLKW